MPFLPLDHLEPFAATLGVMLYPGEDEDSRRRARAYAAQFLAEPIRLFLEAGGTLAPEQLAQIHADAGVPLDDLEARWRDGLATGELYKVFLLLAKTDPSRASWESAAKLVRRCAVEHDVSASRSLLRDICRRYRSVAHLWAAWCIRGRTIRPDLDVGYEGWDDFCYFLAESEMLREWGRTWRPNRAKAKPPLSGDAWRVPEGWAPPESQPGWPRRGGIPDLTIPNDLLAGLRGPGRPRSAGKKPRPEFSGQIF